MTTVHSFPVRQQQQLPSTMYIALDTFNAHFGIRPNINKMFAWWNKWRKVYTFILFLCVSWLFWLPIMNGDPTDIIELSSSRNNNSLTKSQLRNWAFTKRCTLSSSMTIDNTNSYGVMQFLVLALCLCCYVLLMISQYIYLNFSRNELVTPYRWFCWCRKIFICLVSASICNQLASVLGCRPIDIIYDIRYVSMFIVQIIGFFICLLFTFFLGVKYASVKRRD